MFIIIINRELNFEATKNNKANIVLEESESLCYALDTQSALTDRLKIVFF